MEKEIKYSTIPYFSDYTENMDGIVEDLISFADAWMFGPHDEEIEKMKEISTFPIYRGYIEVNNGKQYIDSFLYEGNVYSEDELCDLLKDKNIPFCIAKPSKMGEICESIFPMGVSELFYYKNGPEGMRDYFESNDIESDMEI